jgi:hypothetical protein
MGVAKAEAMLRAMIEPCLFTEPSPAPHAIQGEAPFPLPPGEQSKLVFSCRNSRNQIPPARPFL